MRETETDFKLADDYQTDFEYHKEDAISEMYEHAQCIAQGVQHHINNNCLTVEMDNIDAVYKAIQQLKDLAYYTYTGDREGRWNSQYSDTFEYNLKAEVVDLLADELGYIWENQ
jgi:hypothetical protein